VTITPWSQYFGNKSCLWLRLYLIYDVPRNPILGFMWSYFYLKTHISLFSIDVDHILQYTGFSNVRPAPPAWSRDLCWEWLPVESGGACCYMEMDVGLLKAQFGATRAFLYTQCCYVIHSTSRDDSPLHWEISFLCLLLFKKLYPNGSCGPHFIFRGIQSAFNGLT
jgi:hypothetical protein